MALSAASRLDEEGRYGQSSPGRGARDAMDARCRVQSFCTDERCLADGEDAWSWHPWAGAKSVGDSLQVTVTNKVMDTGEIAAISRKPLRRECRCSAQPVVTLLVCFFHLHTRLRVPAKHPAFPAPSHVFEGDVDARPGCVRAAGTRSHTPGCHAAQKRGIQYSRGA
jgi:hypothetical protein